MIKVCHMTSVHPRYDIRIFRKECVSLMNHGYDVTLLVVDDLPYEELNNIKIIPIKFHPKNRIGRIIGITKVMLKAALKVDAEIYHFHDPELIRIGLILKKHGKKVIFDSHECYVEQIKEKKYIPLIFRKIVSYMYLKYEEYALKKIDAVIFPATLNGKNIFEKKCKESYVINNLPLLSEFYDEYNKSTLKKNQICHVGSLSYNRGVSFQIEAVSEIDVILVLAGNYISKDYENEIIRQKGYKNVDYKGICDRKEIINILNESKIGLATILNVGQYNKFDNLATKVYEYMAMGLPVIITDSDYARKVNETFNCFFLVDPKNPKEIKEKIKYLISNSEIAKRMGENGRKAILERYNWEKEECVLLRLYSKLQIIKE